MKTKATIAKEYREQIKACQNLATDIYEAALEDLGLPDDDWAYDYLFNGFGSVKQLFGPRVG